MRRRGTVLVTMILLLGVVPGGSTAVAAATPANPPGLPMYLALGDSVANGEGSAPTADDYWSTVARWQANGYVAQLYDGLAARLDCLPAHSAQAADGCQLQLLNLARSAVPAMDGEPRKPGVTTSILIEEQLPAATDLLEARNHDSNPGNDIHVVTLTVGGNDIFEPVLTACLTGSPDDCNTAIANAFTEFAMNYSIVLAQLQEAAGPDAVVVTMTYYNPLPYCYIGQYPGAVALGDLVLESAPVAGLGPVGFNGLIEAISHAYGAKVADTFGVLGDGDFVGGDDCLHPTKSGHAKISKVFEDALIEDPLIP